MALKFRRGTTAQQSGSLAFGEPFVNTTLGTLLVGGPNGDIVLSAGGTGSTGNFGPISGSGLDITGNANIGGNVTIGGAITIGDATADTVNVVASLSSSLIPQTTNAFDLGSATKVWRDLYVSTGSIKFVANNTVISTLSANADGSQNFSNGVSITGSLIASGSNIEFTRGWPSVGSESHFLRLAPFTASNGRPYEGIGIAIEHWNDGTDTYEHSLQIHSFDNDSNPTYGAELNVSPFRAHMQAYPSGGVLGGNTANVSVQDLKNGQSQALVYGDYVQIGAYNSEFITIGNSGSVVEISGSIRANITGSIAATNGVVSGSSQVTLQSTTGFSAFDTALSTISGSLISSASAAKTTNDSQDGRLTNLESTTASLNISVSNLNNFSGSQLTQNSALATITGSLISSASAAKTTNDSQDISITNLNSTTASLTQRVAANEAVSGTFARTNSTNTFNGSQTVSGSLTVTEDLIVLGSSSIQTISSSNLVIGASIVTLNTATPSSRFAGLQIIDSGSSGGSGSFLYDAVQDELLFIHRGNGTDTTSSVLLMGPETYNNLGNETYLTNNRLVKGTGKEHIVDSNIFDDGTTISLGSNVAVTGSITISGTVDGVDISVFNSNVNSTTASLLIETANLESFSSSALTRLSALEVEAANLELFTSSINTTIKTRLNAETVVSGSSQVIGILSSLNSYTASNDTTNTTQTSRLDQLSTASGSAITRLGVLEVETANLEAFSSSALTRLSNLEGTDITITLTGDVTGTGTITNLGNVSFATTVAANQVALGTDTTGDYVASLVQGTGVTITNNSGEGATPTIAIGQAVATSSNVQFNSLGIGMTASATAGRIDAANDVVAFSSSDIRFKENIKPIENAIDKIRKISGNTYDWKEENKVEHGYEGNDVGVIAQEIEAVLPQLVQTRESGFKAVKYDKLVALLIEGIKEQQLQIEQLRIDLNNCRNNKGL
jgi:hypothetical protein